MVVKTKNIPRSEPEKGSILNLELPAPRQASGDPAYNLTANLRRSFDELILTKGNKRVVIIGKDEKNPGQLVLDYIGAVMIGSLSGRSNTTDGVTLWVDKNSNNPILARINDYKVMAKSNGRGGTYVGTFSQFVDVCKARALIFGPSIKQFPRQKDQRDTQRGSDEGELVEVTL